MKKLPSNPFQRDVEVHVKDRQQPLLHLLIRRQVEGLCLRNLYQPVQQVL